MKKRCLTAKALAAILSCALIACAVLFAGCSKSGEGEDTQTGGVSQTDSAPAKDTQSAATTAPEETTGDTEAPDAPADDTSDRTDPTPEPPVTQTPTPEPPVTQPVAPQGPDALEFANGTVTVNFEGGVKIAVGVAADDVIPGLGKYTDKLEAPSCVHPGNDVLYFYDGYTVMTSPDASGKSIVAGVEISSDAVKLANGIAVGSTADAVKAAFGSGYTEVFGLIDYDLTSANGGKPCSLSFACIDGPVVSIALTVELG